MSGIRDALSKLDPNDHDQWTTGGLPRLDTVAYYYGSHVNRAEVREAWPEFDRDLALQNLKAASEPLVNEAEDPQQRSGAEIEQEQVSPDLDEPVVIDDSEPDAIDLIEKACLAAQSDRYRHNYDLQAFLRSFHIQQTAIRTTQKRIDERNARRGK